MMKLSQAAAGLSAILAIGGLGNLVYLAGPPKHPEQKRYELMRQYTGHLMLLQNSHAGSFTMEDPLPGFSDRYDAITGAYSALHDDIRSLSNDVHAEFVRMRDDPVFQQRRSERVSYRCLSLAVAGAGCFLYGFGVPALERRRR